MKAVVSKLAVPARRRSRRFARPAVILPWSAGLALALGVGVGVASIPDRGGVIRGCYGANTGRLRVIDSGSGARCKAGEHALTWNREGREGDQGPKGLQGPQGPRGIPGPSGAAGPTVYQGDVKNRTLVLGPQSDPTQIVDTPPLPAGTYLVSYSVGFVLGPADNSVCAAWLKSQPRGNDGVFGVGGNGATESGIG